MLKSNALFGFNSFYKKNPFDLLFIIGGSGNRLANDRPLNETQICDELVFVQSY